MVASAGFVVAAGEGAVWEMDPGRPTSFKLRNDSTGGSVAVFEEVVPSGAGTPLHIHHTSNEVLQVQSGEFTVRLGESVTVAARGAWIFIPLGSRHAWRNSGSEPGTLFNIFAPGAGARAFEQLQMQGVPVGELEPELRERIFCEHGYEFIGWDW